jgi:hypothetical protein
LLYTLVLLNLPADGICELWLGLQASPDKSVIPEACAEGLLLPSLLFCLANASSRQHPVHSECYEEIHAQRFPDPANSLPNPVYILNFVHKANSSALG